MQIIINSKVKHIPSGDIITVKKINVKTYTGDSTLHPLARQVRVKKEDCIFYNEDNIVNS